MIWPAVPDRVTTQLLSSPDVRTGVVLADGHAFA
jgi:hypothetical protein